MTNQEIEEYIRVIQQILHAQEKINEDLMHKIDGLQKIVNYQKQQIDYLTQNNWVFLKKKFSYINKELLDYQMKLPCCGGEHNDLKKHKIIISLTTFPARIYEIKYTLFSLMTQTLQADEIVLWLSEEEFPQKEQDIAEELLEWMRIHDIKIKWTKKNIFAFQKQTLSFQEYPDDIIVSADDDIFYPRNWLELLYEDYLKTGEICCHRCHKVILKENQIQPYNTWGICEENISSYYNFPTGVGGILYPPHRLFCDVNKQEIFMDICPKADDIWIWGMAVLNHQKIHVVQNHIDMLTYVNLERELGITGEYRLGESNVNGCKNDEQIQRIIAKYPEILNILLEESLS